MIFITTAAVPSPVRDCNRTTSDTAKRPNASTPCLNLLVFPLRPSRPWRNSLTAQAARRLRREIRGGVGCIACGCGGGIILPFGGGD